MISETSVKPLEFDYLIIGSGVAGLSLALKAETHLKIGIITKAKAKSGASNWAQGGIASAVSPEDSAEIHVQDTYVAGDGLCRELPVKILTEEGPNTISALIEWGVQFTKDPNSKDKFPFHLALEGGHSRPRILHAEDLTGREIMRAMIDESHRRSNIQYFLKHNAVDLLIDDEGTCCGAMVFDEETEQFTEIRAKVTFMCTGGVGQVFRHTTNPDVATGDGMAMAFRAGARVEDMEFMQFHPTGFFNPGHRSFLISEAVRGHGAILRNHLGEAFMANEHPLKDLAPRDIVARAIDKQMKKHDLDYVFLDITHHSQEELLDRFPNIYEHLKSMGYAMEKDMIPVVPSAHYVCGGIKVNTEAATDLVGLYALGECSCTGVHGANRLASNSLLESVVFADRALADSKKSLERNIGKIERKKINLDNDPQDYTELHRKIKKTMWKKVGIVRTDKSLLSAQARLKELGQEVNQLWAKYGFSPALNEARNLVLVGKMVVHSALARKESRGLHYSLDYPEKKESEKIHHAFSNKDFQ